MKLLKILQRAFRLGILVVASISQIQCSFMPKELKAFFKLPLPEVEPLVYEAGDVKIRAVRSGNANGMPVVFVHGTPGSWEDWKLVVTRPELQRRFNLVAVDRPGWGKESMSSTDARKLSQQSRLLATVLDAVSQGGKVILVGHSFGGPVVVQMALDYPDKVAAIILLAPILDAGLDVVRWYNHVADWALVKWFLPDALDRANDEMLALPPELAAMNRQMATLEVPVWMVQGLDDRLVKPENAVFARKIWESKAYRETLLPNFGHLIPHLRPGEVVLAILAAEEGVAMPPSAKR